MQIQKSGIAKQIFDAAGPSTDRVYQYDGAAGRLAGGQEPSGSFLLGPGNTSPQGIADPPPASTASISLASVANHKSRGSEARPDDGLVHHHAVDASLSLVLDDRGGKDHSQAAAGSTTASVLPTISSGTASRDRHELPSSFPAIDDDNLLDHLARNTISRGHETETVDEVLSHFSKFLT